MSEVDRQADLSLGGFQLWVYGREFPDSENYYDADWLLVKAQCVTDSSSVKTGGPIIRIFELDRFLSECKQVYQDLSGKATLNCIEPGLELVIEMQSRGRFDFYTQNDSKAFR